MTGSINCPCDKRIYIPGPDIRAGLDTIPRQIGTFADFRNALLAGIPGKPALSGWRGRGNGDLGIMTLEMWAYVCDVLAFYDETIAHEIYLRTARRRPSLRKLVELLGYIPAPAAAAFVKPALLGEGRKPVTVPAGTAFRSGAFDNEPPQVFETVDKTVIHPLADKWELEKIRSSVLGTDYPASLYLVPGSVNLEEDDLVLVRHKSDDAQTGIYRVGGLSEEEIEGEKYVRVTFDRPTRLSAGTDLKDVRLLVPKQTASPWTMPHVAGDPLPLDSSHPRRLILDGPYRRIKTGRYIISAKKGKYRWLRVEEVKEIAMAVTPAQTTVVEHPDGNSTIVSPPVRVPATQLTLHRDIEKLEMQAESQAASVSGVEMGTSSGIAAAAQMIGGSASQIIVYYDFFPGGEIVSPATSVVDEGAAGSFTLSGSVEAPPLEYRPASFLLEDKNGDGFEVAGSIDFSTRPSPLHIDAGWRHPLVPPVRVFGNLVDAVRGESVKGEILGGGDASSANQSFVLKKKPLTYVTSPSAADESGVVNTLSVYVNGVKWEETASFYGVSPGAEVYIVRQDDEDNFTVTFGDGVRGARLPSGVDNVTADYRFGAGAAAPPAGSITQLAKPVKGLKGVKNPVAAAGGGDKEAAEKIRTNAPRSALLLGRAVSITDMEAAALRVPGVRAARAEWRLHRRKQCPVVQIWYIGDPVTGEKILQRLRGISEPTIPFAVQCAAGIPSHLAVDMEIDARYIAGDVIKNVRTMLMGEEEGMLLPRNIGIGRPLFRSRIFEAVLSVPGVLAVRGIIFNGLSFAAFARVPEPGEYFDFRAGGVEVNGGTDE